jgi:hypothetical protein
MENQDRRTLKTSELPLPIPKSNRAGQSAVRSLGGVSAPHQRPISPKSGETHLTVNES